MTTITAPPRTWTFQPPASLGIGPITTTCLSFCESDHGPDQAGCTHPSDVWHQAYGPSITLRLTEAEGKFENWRVLEAYLNARPFSPIAAERAPHAAMQLSDNVWTDALDPQAFAEVIDKLAAHVDQLRVMHRQLVAAVAEYEAGGRWT